MTDIERDARFHDQLASDGIRAWALTDPDAPDAVQEFGSGAYRQACREGFDQGENFRTVSTGWKMSQHCGTEIRRWTPRGQQAWIVMHPLLTLGRQKWTIPRPVTRCVLAIKRVAAKRDDSAIKRLKRSLIQSPELRCEDCFCILPAKHAHVDHIVPWLWGGPDSRENLRAVCPDCNMRRSWAKKEMECAWLYATCIADIGFTPETFAVPTSDPVRAWQAAKPDAAIPALIAGPQPDPKLKRQRDRRLTEERQEIDKLRGERGGRLYVPFDQRENHWKHWPDRIRAEPERYAGIVEERVLVELGDPPLVNPHDHEAYKRQGRQLRRLRQVMGRIGWHLAWFTDSGLGKNGRPVSQGRSFFPPETDMDSLGSEYEVWTSQPYQDWD